MSQVGLEARKAYIEAQNEYGSSITVRKQTKAIYDNVTYDLITPAENIDIPHKAFIKNVATNKILAKLTDSQQSYSLYVKFYTDEPLSQDDYKIVFDNDEYNISFLDSSIIKDVIWKYEVLLKK